MAFFQEKSWQEHAEEKIARQLSHLREEVDALTHSLQRMSRHVGKDAGHAANDLLDQAWHQGEVVAQQLGKQAVRTGRAVRKDPVPIIVAVAGLALLASLLIGRRR
jgi:ElaB/YqjD/DUF883 family membrane-anchored ribosome-binding protein